MVKPKPEKSKTEALLRFANTVVSSHRPFMRRAGFRWRNGEKFTDSLLFKNAFRKTGATVRSSEMPAGIIAPPQRVFQTSLHKLSELNSPHNNLFSSERLQDLPDHREPKNDAGQVSLSKPEEEGKPLQGSLRQQLEPALGFDLSAVRIHTDEQADVRARNVEADAVTLGKDIFFKKNQFAQDNPRSRALLVHELTHVRQQLRTNDERVHEARKDVSQLEKEALVNEKLIFRHFPSRPVQQPSLDTGEQPKPATALLPQTASPPVSAKTPDNLRPMTAPSNRSLEGHDVGSPGSSDAKKGPDMQTLAENLYQSLKMRLKIERERMGD